MRISDWSSDVCSSDLPLAAIDREIDHPRACGGVVCLSDDAVEDVAGRVVTAQRIERIDFGVERPAHIIRQAGKIRRLMFVEKRNDLLETSVAQIGQRQAPDRAGLVGLTLVIRNGSAELGLEKHLQMEASLGLELRPVFFEPSITKHRSEEHTSELQSLMRISYAVFCLKKKQTNH